MNAQKKITATVFGEKQLDTFAVMCALSGRRAHELVNDIVLDAIRANQRDAEVQRIVRDMKRYRYGIRIADTAAVTETREAGR